jgi:hypothetical protein
MKKNKKEWTRSRSKALEKCCKNIFYAFQTPGGDSEVTYMGVTDFIESITPWQGLVEEHLHPKEDDGEIFGKFYDAIQISFALGYTCGQILDAQDAETGLILEALREKKALLYLPHKRKAA